MIIDFRHYKYVELDKLPLRLMFIVNFLKTDHMFKFFNDCTGLDLSGGKLNLQSYENKIWCYLLKIIFNL